jgi:hypothetical protein
VQLLYRGSIGRTSKGLGLESIVCQYIAWRLRNLTVWCGSFRLYGSLTSGQAVPYRFLTHMAVIQRPHRLTNLSSTKAKAALPFCRLNLNNMGLAISRFVTQAWITSILLVFLKHLQLWLYVF